MGNAMADCEIGCIKKPKISQITLLFWYVLWLWYLRTVPKNWTIPTKIEWPQPLFSFGPFKRVKGLKNGSKYLIFKNWLDTRLKMETHEPNVHHCEGCLVRFLASVLRFGRSKSHFLSLEKGHFLQTWTPNSTVHCRPWTIGHCVWLTYEDLIYPWFSSTETSTPRSVFCRPQVFLRKTQDLVCDSRHT